MGNGREIRDIALAIARLNHALKGAGLNPAGCIGVTREDLRILAVLPKFADYVQTPDEPGFIKIAGVSFIVFEKPTEASPP